MVLEGQNITKLYRHNTALNNISFSLAKGEILGILGPNGAGKTTLIKIILQLIRQNEGEVSIFGNSTENTNKKKLLRNVGAVIEEPVFFPYLTARETLKHLCSLSGPVDESDIYQTLELVGLNSVADDRISTFSYGMKQRLGIAQALLPDNKLLILDEPTNGLDPHGIAGIRKLLRQLSRQNGISMLISSHLLKEMELICDRVIIVNNGRIISSMGVQELKAETTEVEITIKTHAEKTSLPAGSINNCNIIGREKNDGSHFSKITFQCPENEIPALVTELVNMELSIYEVKPKRMSLEEVFISSTHGDNTDAGTDKIRI